MPSIGAPELIIILLIVLLVFGGAKLPKLARSLREAKDEFETSAKTDPKKDARNGSSADANDKVTLSKSELDALLSERELKAKRD